jgi:hypothetical protein
MYIYRIYSIKRLNEILNNIEIENNTISWSDAIFTSIINLQISLITLLMTINKIKDKYIGSDGHIDYYLPDEIWRIILNNIIEFNMNYYTDYKSQINTQEIPRSNMSYHTNYKSQTHMRNTFRVNIYNYDENRNSYGIGVNGTNTPLYGINKLKVENKKVTLVNIQPYNFHPCKPSRIPSIQSLCDADNYVKDLCKGKLYKEELVPRIKYRKRIHDKVGDDFEPRSNKKKHSRETYSARKIIQNENASAREVEIRIQECDTEWAENLRSIKSWCTKVRYYGRNNEYFEIKLGNNSYLNLAEKFRGHQWKYYINYKQYLYYDYDSDYYDSDSSTDYMYPNRYYDDDSD